MIRRCQFSRRNQSQAAKIGCWAPRRLLSRLAFAAIFAASAAVSPASAQQAPHYEPGELGVEIPAEIPAEIPDGGQLTAPFASGPDAILHEAHDSSFVLGGGVGGRGCPPGWGVQVGAVLLKYGDDTAATLSNNFSLGDFGYQEGVRLSVVRHLDCLDGWEGAFIGGLEWEKSGQLNGAGLTSRLSSTTVNLSEFSNATFQSQSYRSRLNGGEINRRWYGWDVISTLVGVRYLSINEDFIFNSTGAGGAGFMSVGTDNNMAGPQIGVDLIFPIGKFSTRTTIKGSLMGNRSETNVQLINAGTVEVANSSDTLKVASLLEMGYYLSYQATRRVRFYGGYEFLWLNGFATATSQVANPITSQTGSAVSTNNDVFFHGVSAGMEYLW